MAKVRFRIFTGIVFMLFLSFPGRGRLFLLGGMEGPQALHIFSAGGGVYVAEEQLEAASCVNFWP